MAKEDNLPTEFWELINRLESSKKPRLYALGVVLYDMQDIILQKLVKVVKKMESEK